MSELSSKDLAAVALRWIEDYRRAPSIKQGWRLVRILERVLADRAEVERAAAEKAWFAAEAAFGQAHDLSNSDPWSHMPANPYQRSEAPLLLPVCEEHRHVPADNADRHPEGEGRSRVL